MALAGLKHVEKWLDRIEKFHRTLLVDGVVDAINPAKYAGLQVGLCTGGLFVGQRHAATWIGLQQQDRTANAAQP